MDWPSRLQPHRILRRTGFEEIALITTIATKWPRSRPADDVNLGTRGAR